MILSRQNLVIVEARQNLPVADISRDSIPSRESVTYGLDSGSRESRYKPARWEPRTPDGLTRKNPMKSKPVFVSFILVVAALTSSASAFQAGSSDVPAATETKGLLADPGFFPIAVWLQDPRQAERYKEAGINLYVALWRGPNEEQLATL